MKISQFLMLALLIVKIILHIFVDTKGVLNYLIYRLNPKIHV
jgi:hypothetical protein